MNQPRSLSLVFLPATLLLACALAGCGTSAYEVVTYPNGAMRIPSSADADGYCRQRGQSVQIQDRAPAQTGVMFRCI